ncbi:transport and Golgi organization protein 6 homolog [Lineus longissimus]|uniref:transport and Golgi organization protein 6 homolog n=1 Tax=Lineus longissimus TaxID=88925 RepID=UPI00315CC5B6
MEPVASLNDARTAVQPDMVLRVLSEVTRPIAKGSVEKSKQGRVISFDDILKESIKNLEKCLFQDKSLEAVAQRFTLPEEDDIHWQFVTVCLDLLKLLNQSMKVALKTYDNSASEDGEIVPNNSETESDQKKVPKTKRKQVQAPPDVLNVSQQKTVSTVFQFIVCLGVCPYLSPGVGVPVEFRSSYGQYLKSSRTVQIPDKINRLSACLDVLSDCALQPSFGSLFLASHLNDLLAALLQLCCGYAQCWDKTDFAEDTAKNISGEPSIDIDFRLKSMDLTTASPGVIVSALQTRARDTAERLKKGTSMTKSSAAPSDSTSNENMSSVCQEKYKKCLNELLQRVYPPLLVRELVVLQGGPRQPPNMGAKVPAFPRAPSWLRRACGRLLSEQVMKPMGVHHVLRGLLQGAEGGGSSTSDGSGTGDDWKKCNAIAQIIANCPKQACSVEEYYRLISPQVLQLFHIKDRIVARQFVRVASSIVTVMVKKYSDLAKAYIISPLLQPLNKCLEINDEIKLSEPGVHWLPEESLTSCVEDIYKVFVSGPDPHTNLLMCLMPVISVIFKLFCFCKSGVSQLRSSCQEMVTTFLKSIDKGVAFQVLKALAFDSRVQSGHNSHGCRLMHPALKFAPAENGGVAVITCARETLEDEGNKTDVQVYCLVEILKDLQTGGLAGEFFLFFLEELTSVLSQEDDINTDSHLSSCNRGEELLDIEHSQEQIRRNNERRLMIMMLLIKMCETMDHTYLNSAQQVIKFAKSTLLRSIYILEHTEDVDTGVFESETITLAIGLLTATMSGAVEIKADDRERMKELLPLLDLLATKHPHEEVQDMASDIRIAIATYGAVWTDSLASAAKKFSKREENEQATENVKGQKLIEEITSGEEKVKSTENGMRDTDTKLLDAKSVVNGSDDTGGGEWVDCSADKSGVRIGSVTEPYGSDGALTSDTGTADSNLDDKYGKSGVTGLLGQCLNELCDPLIPVRGHALITLAKLVKQKDTATLEKTELLLGIFKENIAHDDSYIYLAAINGLAGLSELNHEQTVPMLAEEFIAVVDVSRKPRAVELRMKLAEVLMKVSRSLGDLIPKYREVLVNAFLAGSKDPDHLIRASSLSNLGQVCQLLRFSLGSILQEVFLCTSSLLRSDSEVEVRRAAVMVITMILRGTSHDAIQILDTTLKDIYRLLKQCNRSEKDETVRLQTQLALEELDDIMKKYLFPKQSLVKTIYVADKPCQT